MDEDFDDSVGAISAGPHETNDNGSTENNDIEFNHHYEDSAMSSLSEDEGHGSTSQIPEWYTEDQIEPPHDPSGSDLTHQGSWKDQSSWS
jgi:hypothetical protein